MEEAGIKGINVKHGFNYVGKSRKDGQVWEKGNVRLRTAMQDNPAEPRVACETLIPCKSMDILHFLLSDGERSTSTIRVLDEQIILKDLAENGAAYEAIIHRASNIDVLIKDEEMLKDLSDLLAPMPRVPYTEDQIDEKPLVLLGRRLQQALAIQVHATCYTLFAYLDALGALQIFEAKPANFMGHAERLRLLNLLTKAAASLKGVIVALNMDPMLHEEQSYASFMASFQYLNLLPEYCGGRFILYHSLDSRIGDNPLPCVALPDIYRKVYAPMLEGAGVQMKVSTIHSLSCLLKAGLTNDEILSELEEESKLFQEASHSTGVLSDQIPGPGKKDGKSLAHQFRQEAFELFGEHVSGHGEIVSDLIKTILSWFILRVTKPLVLSFCGPSGTGKNHICKILSMFTRRLFNTSAEQYIPFNAGNVVHRTGIWALTGVQAGLKGMHSKGILESVGPGCVLSIDELDKTSPENEIQDFLVSLLDEGAFRNGYGRHIRLPRWIIVLTMNAGPSAAGENTHGMGFLSKPDKEHVREHYRDFFEKNIHPALRGRISKSYFFGYLGKEELDENIRIEALINGYFGKLQVRRFAF